MEELEQYRIIEEEKKGKGCLVVILVLIILLVGLVLGYYFVFLSAPKLTDKIFNNLEKQIQNIDFKSPTMFSFNGDFSFDSSIDDYSSLNDYKIDYDIGMDYINKKIGMDLSVSDKDLKIDILFYLKNGFSYIDIENITPTILKVEADEEADKIFEQADTESYVYLINTVFNAIKENVSDEKLSRTVVFNELENSILTLKLNYLIDEEEYKKLKKEIINSILNDDKALEGYANLMVMEKEEAKKELKELLEKTPESVNSNISLYIDPFSNKILKITVDEDKETLVVLNEENSITISCKEEESNETIDIFYNKEILQLGIDMKIMDEETEKLSRMNLILNLKEYNEENLKTTGTITYMPLASKENEYIKIDFTYNYIINEFIEEVDLSKAKTIEELTEDELMDFYQSILEFTENLPLDSLEI